MQKLQGQYDGRIQLQRWSFALRPVPDPTAAFHGTYREAAWRQASDLSRDVGVTFRMWARPDFPQWSLPALEAAKCAELQGPKAFERVHIGLFRAFFHEGVNIGRTDEVIGVIRQAGLDMDRFLHDYETGSQRDRVLEEHHQAVARYGVRAIPTVIIGEAPPIVGAVSLRDYEGLLKRLLQ